MSVAYASKQISKKVVGFKKLLDWIRTRDGKSEMTSFCIVDAHSIQNSDIAESNDYDAGKNILESNDIFLLDTNGLPHALSVTTVNVTDNSGAILVFEVAKRNLSLVTNAQFYFDNPYHSWERGLNEHHNGLIMDFLPKKTDFRNVNVDMVRCVENNLNNRPRKALDFLTLAEAMFNYINFGVLHFN